MSFTHHKAVVRFIILLLLTGLVVGPGLAQDEEVVLIVPDPSSLEAWYPIEAINTAFLESHPNVTLEFGTSISASQDEIRFLAQAAGGNIDDVVGGGDESPDMYGPRGIYIDLKSRMEQDADLWFNEDVFLTDFQYETPDGKIYGIPLTHNPIVIMFNVDVFEAAGVPLPPLLYNDPNYEADWTWEGFLETARALTQDTDGDGETDVWGVALENNWQVWVPMVYQNGGRLTNEDDSDFLIDDPAVVEALQFYTDLVVKEGVAPLPTVASTLGGSDALLREGKVGMWIVGGWMRQAFLEEVEAGDLRLGIAPLPFKEESATLFLGMRFSIATQAENPDLAYEYIKAIFADKEALASYFREQGNMPWLLGTPRHDYFDEVIAEGGTVYECYGSDPCFNLTDVANDAYAHIINDPPYGGWFPQVRDIVKGNLELVFNGEITLEEAIEFINQEADPIMEIYLP